MLFFMEDLNMAYKFQLGDFRASGSLIQEGSIESDGTLKLDGVADAALDVSADSFYFKDGDGLMKSDTMADYATAIAGAGLAAGSGVLSVDIDELSALGGTGLHQTDDHFMFSDGGTEKKITFSNLQDAIFADVSGDATIAAGGALTIAAASVENSMLADDAVGADELAANAVVEASIVDNAVTLAKMAGLARGKIIIGDASGDPSALAAGANGKLLIADDNGDASWTTVSGDITFSAGAATIGSGVVEHGMLAEDIISGQGELAQGGLAAADELMISDAGVIKRYGVDSLAKDALALTTEAAMAVADDYIVFLDGGASGETKKEQFSDVVGNMAGVGLGATSGVLAVQVSGALKIASDKVGISGSFAGHGLTAVGGDDSISSLTINASPDSFLVNADGLQLASNVAGAGLSLTTGVLAVDVPGLDAITSGLHQDDDHLLINDAGTPKKMSFSNFEDELFGNISGDIAVAAGGAATIQANAVEGSMLNNNIVSGLTDIGAALAVTDEIIVSDAGSIKRMDLSRLSTMMQSTGLADSSGQLSVAAAQTSITSIINASIGKIGTAANQEYIDFSTANEIIMNINDTPALAVSATGVTVEGNLTVLGSTTSVNSTTINISSSFTFEGPADAHETTLHCATPIADTTINLPQLAAGTYHLPALADAASAASAAVTAAEFALLDGGATQSTGVTLDASADSFFYNDGGVMKHLRVKEVKSFMQGLTVQNIDDAGTCKVGINYFSSLGGAEACTLPASSGLVAGDIVYVKGPSNCSNTNAITINRAGSQTIDGQTSLVLESPFAAVTLVYVAADTFVIV
jgi:hypothetical protein